MSELTEKIKVLAGEYAHCYSFVGDDTMPRKQKQLYDAIDEAQQQIDELQARVEVLESALEEIKQCPLTG